MTIGISDRLELPDGVRVGGDCLADVVRDARFPTNETGLFVLRRTGRPLGEIAAELALHHRLALARARFDVLRFAFALNRAELANVVPGDGALRRALDWLRLAVRLAPAGSLPTSVARRSPLDTTTPVRGVVGTARALLRRCLAISVAAAALALPGGHAPGALALGVGVGLGLMAHEAGHVALLAGVGAALVVSGLRTYVIHPSLAPRRRRAVAAAGPIVAALLGLALVAAAWLARSPELALAGCAPAAHAAGLTVATGDGRVACGL